MRWLFEMMDCIKGPDRMARNGQEMNMTPQEYLKKHKPLFAGARFTIFHMVGLINAAKLKIEQPFRETPTWALAVAATFRGRYGESNEARSTLETMAFRANQEFTRRIRLAAAPGC